MHVGFFLLFCPSARRPRSVGEPAGTRGGCIRTTTKRERRPLLKLKTPRTRPHHRGGPAWSICICCCCRSCAFRMIAAAWPRAWPPWTGRRFELFRFQSRTRLNIGAFFSMLGNTKNAICDPRKRCARRPSCSPWRRCASRPSGCSSCCPPSRPGTRGTCPRSCTRPSQSAPVLAPRYDSTQLTTTYLLERARERLPVLLRHQTLLRLHRHREHAEIPPEDDALEPRRGSNCATFPFSVF